MSLTSYQAAPPCNKGIGERWAHRFDRQGVFEIGPEFDAPPSSNGSAKKSSARIVP
jgi:hypothetical protein